MEKDQVSLDEFLSARKNFVKAGDILVKAAKGPATWNPDARSARFVMSTETPDRDKDIVFQDGLDITEFMKNPVAPFAHASYTFPVGTWGNVEKLLNGRPKRTEGDLILLPEGGDPIADQLAVHLAAGTIRACSIGFIPRLIKRREIPEDPDTLNIWPGYEIIESELVECSPVCIPAQPQALVKSAAKGDVLARETIEEILDTWTRDPANGLLVPRAEFEQAHKAATGERQSVTVSMDIAPGPSLKALLDASQEDAAEPAKRSFLRRALDALTGEEKPAEPKPTVSMRLQALETEYQKHSRRQKLVSRFDALQSRMAERSAA